MGSPRKSSSQGSKASVWDLSQIIFITQQITDGPSVLVMTGMAAFFPRQSLKKTGHVADNHYDNVNLYADDLR